jgi:DNA-binding transcriptional LysR family regulator
MINFRLLRHFWSFMAVAEERHFGRAARRLGMSQPPLSQQIQQLERTLGVRLFERSREGARLTREGAQILAPVRSFLDHAYRLENTVMDIRHGRGAGLAFGAINSAMFDIMPHVLNTARQQFPTLSLSLVEMDSAQALSAVRNGEVDLAFARFDHAITPLEVRPITIDHLVVALPVSHRLSSQAEVSLGQLADESLVLFPRRISPHYFDVIVTACRNAGFSPRVLHEIGSVVSQIGFVGCGFAVGLVPSRSMRFGSSSVVFRPLVERIDVVTIAAIWNPSLRNEFVPKLVDAALEIGGHVSQLKAALATAVPGRKKARRTAP